ncbi:chemotaxis protein CheA [Ahrensia marina]|jgi:two-component system chemotaxis sensor kinase CheA|uniref:chemotaxis protein CheA n=1 Tax=Ahrensia marina TaxID=1514904 RepID=UPI0006B56A17|nr:chemotaxis protein CheA [Ahrensia marina]
MNMDAIKDTYFAECGDQLAELESGLFDMSSGDTDPEIINSVFRAVHSIKGGAGAFALDDLVNFAHVFENALDVIRSDNSQSSPERIDLLLRCADVLNDIVTVARDGGDKIDCEEITKALENEFNLEEEDENAEEAVFDAVPISLDAFDFDDFGTPPKAFQIAFAPQNELYLHGHDPQRIFRELGELGTCTAKADTSKIPALDGYDPKVTNLSWNLTLEADANLSDVKAPFEWVEDFCTLEIEEPEEAPLEGGDDISDFLGGLDAGDDVDTSAFDDGDSLGAPVDVSEESEEAAPSLEVVETKAAPPAEAGKERQAASKPIRVDSAKVDRLINLMGEMVISQSMLTMQINDAGFTSGTPAGLALVELQNLTRDIQSSVMAIRAQPIKPVFMRMSRVVREVASATGKKANLVLEGESTEVDTTVIEGLSDPLTHMIRNSVDHGIESAEKRLAAGKPEVGEIRLSASHSSGSIVIEIRDDGAGINRPKVLEIARKKGIVSPDAKLSDDEIDNLIFAPGFSTSDEITDVSGRGVGMDVVRQSIQGLGGRVLISSEPGKGSHFTLHLPLTLAILDGMLVKTSEQILVLPVTSVIETIMFNKDDVFVIGEGNRVLKLRGQLVPLIDIGNTLGFSEKTTDWDNATIVVVESRKNEMSALVVDSIVGQQQVVIKSMESNYKRIPSIAAATILGSGRIALILDVDDIVSRGAKEITAQPSPKLEKIA